MHFLVIGIRNFIGKSLGYATCDACHNTLWATKDHTSPYTPKHLHSSNSICDKCFKEFLKKEMNICDVLL